MEEVREKGMEGKRCRERWRERDGGREGVGDGMEGDLREGWREKELGEGEGLACVICLPRRDALE